MSEKTAEEKAALEIAEYIDEAWLQVSHLTSKGRLAFIEVAATKSILVAVAAERERCANEDPSQIECPTCSVPAGQRCANTFTANLECFHTERWRAAIRKGTR